MPSLDTALIIVAGIALFAAFVNGAIGYGFSSLTVPLGLLFYTNRILNPAVVVVEVLINFYVLFINRNGVPAVLKRVFPILIGLLPGIAIGAFVVASVHPGWIKLGTYTVILPLILIQAAGWRRPIRSAWTIGLPFGTALGAYVIRRLDAETFRRICMSFDAWVVGFGLSRVLIELNLLESPWAYSVLAITILIDAYLLYVFFTVQKAASKRFAND